MMISAIILSHNDEKIVGNALKSVTWCDERIVIDDFSTDATETIAKKLGAVVYKRRLADDFAAQRNFGLSKATGDWVLFIDSDEEVSEDLQHEISIAIEHSQAEGFFLRRQDIFLGKRLKYGETNRVRLLRLAKRQAGAWRRPVHEVWQITGNTGELQHPLNHTPHTSVGEFLTDINIYSTLNAKHFYEQGVRSSVLQIIGYPIAKFFVNDIWFLGFLDGTPGAIIAIMMSFHSFLTRAKLYILWRDSKKTV